MKGIIFGGGKFGYKDLPKTASTSIEAAIYQMETGKAFCHKAMGMHIHAYMNKRKKGDISMCDNRFVVVRDPIERFLSAYKNRVVFHGELSEPFIKEKFSSHYHDIPHFTPGLGQFIDHMKVYFLINPIFHHFRPISDFLGDKRLGCFTHVYKMENLNDLEKDLSMLTGKEIVFDHRQTGGKKYSLRDLSKIQIEKLIKFYQMDYDLLEGFYSVDDLWRKWRGDEHASDVPRALTVKGKFLSFIKTKAYKIDR
jgi:hypothetical protein